MSLTMRGWAGSRAAVISEGRRVRAGRCPSTPAEKGSGAGPIRAGTDDVCCPVRPGGEAVVGGLVVQVHPAGLRVDVLLPARPVRERSRQDLVAERRPGDI